MPTTENYNTDPSWTLVLESLREKDAENGGFGRALEISPRLLASSGLLPMNGDSGHYYDAIHDVMPAGYRDDVQACADVLERIAHDCGIAEAIKDLQLESPQPPTGLGALATQHAWPQVDAAYRLGVAMGITFAQLMGGAR